MASCTPFAQIRIPVGDLFFLTPPLPTYAHTTLLEEKLSGGVKIMRRQSNCPTPECLSGADAGGPKIRIFFSSKKPHSLENCRTVSKIPASISQYIARYPLPKTERHRLS